MTRAGHEGGGGHMAEMTETILKCMDRARLDSTARHSRNGSVSMLSELASYSGESSLDDDDVDDGDVRSDENGNGKEHEAPLDIRVAELLGEAHTYGSD